MSNSHSNVNEQEKATQLASTSLRYDFHPPDNISAAVILALGITLKLLGKLVED